MRNLYYTILFLTNARREIDLALSDLSASGASTQRLQDRVSEAISLLSKAWHVRNFSQSQFESLTAEELDWLRTAIPDLIVGSKSFRVVPADCTVGEG